MKTLTLIVLLSSILTGYCMESDTSSGKTEETTLPRDIIYNEILKAKFIINDLINDYYTSKESDNIKLKKFFYELGQKKLINKKMKEALDEYAPTTNVPGKELFILAAINNWQKLVNLILENQNFLNYPKRNISNFITIAWAKVYDLAKVDKTYIPMRDILLSKIDELDKKSVTKLSQRGKERMDNLVEMYLESYANDYK